MTTYLILYHEFATIPHMSEFSPRDKANKRRERPVASMGGFCFGALDELSTPVKVIYTKYRHSEPADVNCEMLSPQDACEATTERPSPPCILFEKKYASSEDEMLTCAFPFGTGTLEYNREEGIIEASPLWPDGHESVELPHAESKILEMLMQNRGKILSPRQLYEYYSGMDYVASRTVDAHISRLRKALGQRMVGENKTEEIIKTRPNVGYFIPRGPRNGEGK